MDKSNFAKIIKKTREEKNITQSQLAERARTTTRAVQYWEQGKKNISVENADKLLKALGIEITIGGSE